VIFDFPKLESADREVLQLLDEQRKKLHFGVGQNPARWTGFLRRNTFARALQGSNSIEGYNATLSEAVAIVDDERPESLEVETAKALEGYRTAMTYILRVHNDPHTRVDAGFLRSLHFMMLSYDLTKLPGQWRPGDVYVVQEATGDPVYKGPDADDVAALIEELITQLGQPTDPAVSGAMAHLNLAMIHPFKDGNGRMARALQTLALARHGVTHPIFSSIEEWLGRNTQAYYAILAEVGRGEWSPRRTALPWVRFCLRAHYQQAATLLRRNRELGAIWEEVTKLIAKHDLPERTEIALVDAAFGYQVRNQHYRDESQLSEAVAGRDLRRLSELGLLAPVGEKRGRHYVAGEPLKELRVKLRDPERAADPYEVVKRR
jgi:Fic family protein